MCVCMTETKFQPPNEIKGVQHLDNPISNNNDDIRRMKEEKETNMSKTSVVQTGNGKRRTIKSIFMPDEKKNNHNNNDKNKKRYIWRFNANEAHFYAFFVADFGFDYSFVLAEFGNSSLFFSLGRTVVWMYFSSGHSHWSYFQCSTGLLAARYFVLSPFGVYVLLVKGKVS